jgi:hypothetical protein
VEHGQSPGNDINHSRCNAEVETRATISRQIYRQIDPTHIQVMGLFGTAPPGACARTSRSAWSGDCHTRDMASISGDSA